MKVSEQLIAAKALISKPENWTQRSYARDADGYTIDPFSTYATCFCALGAIRVATHAEVLSLFDAAIEIAVQEELSVGQTPTSL